MNLSQLRAQIDRRTGKKLDILAANSFINEAIDQISNHREWPWLDALQTITTTVDVDSVPVATYDVSAAYTETRTVNVGGLEAQQIYIADGDEYHAALYGLPCQYQYSIEWVSGMAQLTFYPAPPEGTIIEHRYTRNEAVLSADTDTPLMPERYHSIIVDIVCALFLEQFSPSRSEFYSARANKALKAMGEATQRKANPGRIRVRDQGTWI